MNRNTTRFRPLALVVLLAGLGLGISGVVAQSDSTTLVDEPVTPTNETESIYLDATGIDDMNGSGLVDVTVAVEGLTENETAGDGTILDETTISVAAGTTESYDYALVDADRDYDELRLTATVATADDDELIASTDWGTLQRTSGGAGGGLGEETGAIGTAAVVLVVVWLVGRED
ncbi:hypothetical protein [Halorubrum ezzemoulense]|uniref:hypothetical protein n=1 Tax=Halorubrum ezzemoulense TaxID=337243 RepID=UPI00232CDF4E|nr:hypothetical protein [Halorubrum ezzemoulense]MDB9235351.1 hypothetical protein [Halorubrum ezzemoulense]